MNILVHRFMPSGSMPALVEAVSLTSNNAVARQSSTKPGEEAVVGETYIGGALACASLATIDQYATAQKGRNPIAEP
jgi:hypothetical protein